jgi:hypothetical protein
MMFSPERFVFVLDSFSFLEMPSRKNPDQFRKVQVIGEQLGSGRYRRSPS